MKPQVLYTYYGQEDLIPIIKKEADAGVPTIIVDDCSPKPLPKVWGIDCYKIIDDIHWNNTGAKNLGVYVANDWVINSDIDHIVTKDVYDEICAIPYERGSVYVLGRYFDDGSDDKHPIANVFLIHKDDCEKIGGWDEDFAGHYGVEDVYFFEMCKKHLSVVERRDIKVRCLNFGGAKLERDSSHNQALYREKTKNGLPNKVESDKLRFKWTKL